MPESLEVITISFVNVSLPLCKCDRVCVFLLLFLFFKFNLELIAKLTVKYCSHLSVD